MDTTRWEGGDEFAVLDLVARLKFKTACSLSFELGTRGDRIRVPGTSRTRVLGEGRVFSMIGWLDAHHPCDGSHRLQVRVWLPGRYTCSDSMRAMVPQVKAALGLPQDESYHVVCLAGLSEWSELEEPDFGFAR
jgi:hypothetical protein